MAVCGLKDPQPKGPADLSPMSWYHAADGVRAPGICPHFAHTWLRSLEMTVIYCDSKAAAFRGCSEPRLPWRGP